MIADVPCVKALDFLRECRVLFDEEVLQTLRWAKIPSGPIPNTRRDNLLKMIDF